MRHVNYEGELQDGVPVARRVGTCYTSVRYDQGRWFARFVIKLLLATGGTIALATLVYLTIALFKGVQG